MRLKPLVLILAVLACLYAAQARAAKNPVNTGPSGDVAIQGFDPVAYFTDKAPVQGLEEFQAEWSGVVWRFASAEHRDLFLADPEKYAPRYGGYCAYAVALGTTADIEPGAWSIHDGHLYLNATETVRGLWLKDPAGYIKKADANWPAVLNR